MKQQQYDHENIKRQLEDDADREIYELKAKYEAQLKDEQQLNLDLRAETGIYSKKLNSSQKEIRELKHTITIRDADRSLDNKPLIAGKLPLKFSPLM